MRMQLNSYVLLHTFNFWIMRGEIEIYNIEDDVVEFGIHDTAFRVCIENETYWIEEAVSFNSFTDEIQYEEHQETTTCSDFFLQTTTINIQQSICFPFYHS